METVLSARKTRRDRRPLTFDMMDPVFVHVRMPSTHLAHTPQKHTVEHDAANNISKSIPNKTI